MKNKNRNNIELNIEKMVLHGFKPGDRNRIGHAVERELGRLFSEQGVPSSVSRAREIAGINGGTINVKQNSRAEVIGTRIAQSLYGGFRT